MQFPEVLENTPFTSKHNFKRFFMSKQIFKWIFTSKQNFKWIFMSKHNFKWICWIFPVKMQISKICICVFDRKNLTNRFEFFFNVKTWKNYQSVLWIKVMHVQCLKSQTFSNSCAKNRHGGSLNQTRRDFWWKLSLQRH